MTADVEQAPTSLTALARAADDGLLAQTGPFLDRRFRRYRLVGMGASRLAAAHAAARMRSLGLDAAADLACSPYGYPMDDGTLTVAVSASGATGEVLRAVDRLDGHFPVLAVTDDPCSPLADRAGAVLPLLAGRRAGIYRTFVHTGVLLHGLTLLWSGGLPRMVARDVAVLAQRVAAATTDLLHRRAQWLPEAVAALDAPQGLVGVLAPAERMAAARFSALVLRTAARRAADASESADWLHAHAQLAGGDVDYRALVLAGSPADGRVLDRLADRGAGLVTVGHAAIRAIEPAQTGPAQTGPAQMERGQVERGHSRAGGVAVEFPDDDDTDVARLTEPCVAALVAASL